MIFSDLRSLAGSVPGSDSITSRLFLTYCLFYSLNSEDCGRGTAERGTKFPPSLVDARELLLGWSISGSLKFVTRLIWVGLSSSLPEDFYRSIDALYLYEPYK